MASITITETDTRIIMTCCSYRTPHTFVKSFDSVEEFEKYIKTHRCPECTKPFTKDRATVVAGTYNEKKKCNARCMSSTSGVCSCSCGGKNHGGGHIHL